MTRPQRIACFALVLVCAVPALARAQAAGETYTERCAACHAADGSGNPGMATKALGGTEVQKMSDAALGSAIVDGTGMMPGFKGQLTDAEVKALVAYIRKLKK